MKNRLISCLILLLLVCNNFTIFAADNTQMQSFFALFNLELPELSDVKAAVQAQDYTAAANALLEHFKTRTYPVWYNKPSLPKNNTSYNTAKADAVMEHRFTCNSITANPDNPIGSGNINWKYTPNGDPEWYWALNRHFALKDLAYAYFETGREEYAAEFARIFSDWYNDNPVPPQMDTNGTWRTIEAGLRLSESMIYYFNTFLYSDSVLLDVKLNILRSLHDHGEYLYQFSGTNNWLLFECRGLYGLSMFFPEFKESTKWKNTALGRLQTEYRSQFLSDGWQYELTTNYHVEAAKSIYAVQEIAQMNGTNIPFSSDLIKSYEVAGNLLLPGGKLSSLNDTTLMLGNDFLYQGAKLADSTMQAKTGAFLAGATGYMNGDGASLNLSVKDAWAGLVHLRDYRGKNEIYAMLEAGESGIAGHGWSSRDKLQFILSANDRELLIDPGVYSYTNVPIANYMYTTSAHNTVTIDGYDQIRRGQDLSKEAENVDFFTSGGMDYASGLYNEDFDEIKKIPVTHKREVVYVKSGYFVINDTFKGSGAHTARQFWNFAPSPYTVNTASGQVNTNFPDGSNVLMIPVDYAANSMETAYGGTAPYRGWTNVAPNIAVPTLNINYKKTFTGSGDMQTVIIPYKGSTPPNVTVKRIDGIIELNMNGNTDRIFIGSCNSRDYAFGGTAAVVRSNTHGIIGMNKYPPDSSLTFRGTEVAAPQIPLRTKPETEQTLSNSGMVQAEWAGIKRTGAFEFKSENNGAVKLGNAGQLAMNINSGLSSIVIRARADEASALKIQQNGIDKGTVQITSGKTFNNYTVSGLGGGEIKVVQVSGSPIIDYFTLNGNSTNKINQYILRNRTASPYAATKFGNSDHTDYEVKADLKIFSPLTDADTSTVGIILRDNYKLQYNCKKKTLSIMEGSVILSAIYADLAYDQWYTFKFSAAGNLLSGTVSLNGTASPVLAQISATSSGYAGGMAGVYCEYADAGADNVTLTLGGNSVYMSEDFERYAVGTRATNWIDVEGGLWRTEGVESLKEQTPAVNTQYLSERFDAYQGGLMPRWSGTSNNLTAVAVNGNINMKLNNPSGTSEVYYSMAQQAANTVMLEAEYIFSSNVNAPIMIMRQGDGAESFNFKFDSDGKIKSMAAGNKVFATYMPNKKYKVRMIVNFSKKKYDLYLNGEQIAEDEPLLGNTQNVKTVYFLKLWSVGSALIDNAYIADVSTTMRFEVQNMGETVLQDAINSSRGDVYLGVFNNNKLTACMLLNQEQNIIPVYLAQSFVVKLFNWENMIPMAMRKEYVIN